jgi:hypothetical protein
MIRRLLKALDPDLLTAAIGVWLAGQAPNSASLGWSRLRVLWRWP